VLPETVIDRQVARQPLVAFLRVLERHSVGPFTAKGLDEPFGLAIGPWRVEPRTPSALLFRSACSAAGISDCLAASAWALA
jgi:hypothetical protein